MELLCFLLFLMSRRRCFHGMLSARDSLAFPRTRRSCLVISRCKMPIVGIAANYGWQCLRALAREVAHNRGSAVTSPDERPHETEFMEIRRGKPVMISDANQSEIPD